jgi:enterochelin esterase-like enzyme
MNSAFLHIFGNMQLAKTSVLKPKSIDFPSEFLKRNVRIDFYLPSETGAAAFDLLLINDGQDLLKMEFSAILDKLYASSVLRPVLCVGIHAGKQRKSEYGTAVRADYKGRGNLAGQYMHFVIRELIPAVCSLFPATVFSGYSFAGFSLGGLSALDIAWNHRNIFSTAGVFSGSLWWRMLDKDDPAYADDLHRIMHNQIREGRYLPGMKFFFECGTEDETEDRNGNGIIDSIDDANDLIFALIQKGYQMGKDINYQEITGGKHDLSTWAASMPLFLQWAFPGPAMQKF